MTIDELADACYVSKGKISKFCKNLGYDSFIAFKDDCLKQLSSKKIAVEKQRIGLEIDFINHLHKSLGVIETNLGLLDTKEIDLLVKEISKNKYIFLYGNAYTNLLCHYIQYECDFLDKEVIVLDETLNKDYIMNDNSLLIVLSVEGNS